MLPLSVQLGATAKAVAFVMAGRSLSDVLADGSIVKPDLRAGVQALSFAVLRNWGMAITLRQQLVAREPMPAVDALLCSALALLVSGENSGANYTDFTIVNQTVDAAKLHSKTRTSASFVNAVLRRFLREREVFTRLAMQGESAIYNHPQWWIDQLKQEQPDRWQEILLANQHKPALSLRVNEVKTTIAAFKARLNECEIVSSDVPLPFLQPYKDTARVLAVQDAPSVPNLPGYSEGLFSVQDLAAQATSIQLLSDAFLSQLVARAKDGYKVRVLDACAAPGGKTTHLIERLICAFRAAGLWDGNANDWDRYFQVVALEIDAKRARRIHENLSRLKLRATVKIANAADLSAWWDGVPFDAVLLDAPCTASGIVRRHPDVRWLRRATDSDTLSFIQLELLKTLWRVVRAEGRLLYAICSIFKAEGDGVISHFLQQEIAANQLDSHGLWLPSSQHDGFYDALFEKAKT